MNPTVSILLQVLGWAMPSICTIFLTVIVSKQNKKKQEQSEKDIADAAIKKSIKYIMKRNLQNDYNYYHELGYCPLDDKTDIQEEYELYHQGLKGNGAGTKYYDAIMALPDDDPNLR